MVKKKVCRDWDVREVLVAACPYCSHDIDDEVGYADIGDDITCPQCKKVFILGEI